MVTIALTQLESVQFLDTSMEAPKISVIGAGSAEFSVSLVRDICLTDGLVRSTISLMDTNKQRLDAIYAMATRYAEKLGKKIRFEKTTSRVQHSPRLRLCREHRFGHRTRERRANERSRPKGGLLQRS